MADEVGIHIGFNACRRSLILGDGADLAFVRLNFLLVFEQHRLDVAKSAGDAAGEMFDGLGGLLR